MKVLTEVSQQKVIYLLKAQLEASYRRFETAHEDVLREMEIGIGAGFSTAIGMINKSVEDDGRFTEEHLDRIRSVADFEESKIKRVEDADDNTRIFWRHEVATMMTACALIEGHMTEEES